MSEKTRTICYLFFDERRIGKFHKEDPHFRRKSLLQRTKALQIHFIARDLCRGNDALYFLFRATTRMVSVSSPRPIHRCVLCKYYFLLFFLFSGLGGLGPEYLLHAAGPASTLASSEFPFSIDGKSNNMYPLFNVHVDVCTCDLVMCAVPSYRCSGTTGR